jgi:DinB superfamily
MHPHLTEGIALLDEAQAALRAAVAAVPPSARSRKPAPDRWSVNEVLEHLALATTRFTASVGGAVDKARAAGIGAEQAARVPLDETIRRRLADRGERRQAPENMLPGGALDAEAAWAAQAQAHDGFVRTLTSADGLALSGVTADHRRWGPLTVYQWAECLAGHEKRHAEQIAELR